MTAKYHSAEMGDTLRGSNTAIPRLAARKLYGIGADFPHNSSDFVKFLVTCTVCMCTLCQGVPHSSAVHVCTPGITMHAIPCPCTYMCPCVDLQASVVDPLLNMHLPAFDRLLAEINNLGDGKGACYTCGVFFVLCTYVRMHCALSALLCRVGA